MAIKLNEFQVFMQEEIKITDKELEELKKCGGCWNNFAWLDKTVAKINERLEKLKAENKLKTKKSHADHKIFTKDQKEEALKYIKNSDADFFQIILRKKT